MTYDLVIRGGTVVDGSGLPRYRGDVAVTGGRIARIAPRLRESGREEIDARDLVLHDNVAELYGLGAMKTAGGAS